MTEVIIENCYEIKDSVKLGEIRTDRHGRIIMVVEVKRYYRHGPITRTLKALVIREGRNGECSLFSTVPKEYGTAEELAERYPKVLTGSLTIKGVD